MFLFGPQFDPNKCKVQLKLAVSRIQILKNKKANLVRDEKRHIAELLRNRNEESARIRVETVIRDEYLIECYNIVEVLCELLFARLPLITATCEVPSELKESIYTLIYASQRIQIPELELIRKQLLAKYGRGLEHEVNCHCQTYVNPKIVYKLSYVTPEPFLVFQYLNEIAYEGKVDWCVDPIPPPTASVGVAPGPSIMMQQPAPHMSMFPSGNNVVSSNINKPSYQTPTPPPPPPAYTPTPQPQFPSVPTTPATSTSQPAFPAIPPQYTPTPGGPAASSSSTATIDEAFPDFDELTARFEALKRQNNMN
ncbi:hypothetical protein SAMD00019534_068950 [Acytostelium subglobosum LB1]|uniref:hypothetical protein n=1 Tax=Acytostelium subglobosum LB1 TaxID=1410327 RepID=UPI000644E153|nr:hypothetical protein SAMD00019534_068950 [Acytostelium subglobosum LB1]GAM23720.1 hypothetical protein SAMD00019534_068950 [Acytostelium subglobosum LB1]|eukprot:XP_012753461.1 hypothetical protein SAMD00019534_068950 [Acytostelium subglobosum LB1]